MNEDNKIVRLRQPEGIEDPLTAILRSGARRLLECLSLAAALTDDGTIETREAFTARLRATHGRKSGLWSRFNEVAGTQP